MPTQQLIQKGQQVDDIIYRLRNGNINTMLEAAKQLGGMGEKAVEPLMPLLKDENDMVRLRAAIAFQRIGPPAAPYLIKFLDDKDQEAKGAAIWAIGHIGDQNAVDPLIRMLNVRHNWTRWASMAALVKLGDPKGVAAAREAIKGENSDAREIIEELIERS